MIAEAGLTALWLAAGLAGYQIVLMLLSLRSTIDVVRPMRAVAVVQGALTLIAFAMLLLVFARSDMSVALVFENSNSAKPFIYKVAGAWGNHEGSMLMWVTILAKHDERYMPPELGNLSAEHKAGRTLEK